MNFKSKSTRGFRLGELTLLGLRFYPMAYLGADHRQPCYLQFDNESLIMRGVLTQASCIRV